MHVGDVRILVCPGSKCILERKITAVSVPFEILRNTPIVSDAIAGEKSLCQWRQVHSWIYPE